MRKEYTIITIKQIVLGSAFVFGFALIFLFFSFVDQAQAFDEYASGLEISAEQLEDLYGGCPDPEDVCAIYHPGSIMTAYCAYEENFEMCYGEEMRAMAADDSDDFPKTWFVWSKGTMTTLSGTFECILTQFGKKKTLLEIPDDEVFICMAILETSDHRYYLHFASNPSGCLGWVQCMEN